MFYNRIYLFERALIFIHCIEGKLPSISFRFFFIPMCKRFYLIVQKDNFTLFFEPFDAKYGQFFFSTTPTLSFACLHSLKEQLENDAARMWWCASIRANITRLLLICHLIAMLTWCTTTLYRSVWHKTHIQNHRHTGNHNYKWKIIIIFI